MATPIKFKPIHPVATILGHLRLIVGMTVGGTILLTALILWKVKPLYQSSSAIEIAQLVDHMLVRDEDRTFVSRIQYTDYVNTQVSYIVSYENVQETLAKLDLSKTSVIRKDSEAETIGGFLSMLEVGWVPNTNLVSVSVSSSDPKGLDLLANTLVDTYMENNLERELASNRSRLEHLREEEARKRKELADMNTRLGETTTRLGTLVTEEQLSPLEENLTFLRRAFNEAFVQRLDAERDYQALLGSIQRGSGLGVKPLVEEKVLNDLAIMRNEMYERMAELTRVSALMTPDHPYLKQLEARLASDRANLDRAMADLRRDATTVIASRLNHDQKESIHKAEAEMDARRKHEDQVRARYDQEMQKQQTTIPLFLAATQLRIDIQRWNDQLTAVQRRLEEVGMEVRAPSRVRIQTHARPPLHPIKNRRRMFALMALCMCATLALVTAFAIDFFQPSIISPQHMTQIIGHRPTGVLAHQRIGDYGQLLREMPESYEADQFRRIMPRIFNRAMSREQPATYLVLPLAPGAGVTSFALNCLTYRAELGRGIGLLSLAVGKAQLQARTDSWGMQPATLSLPSHLRERFPLELRANGSIEIYCPIQPIGKRELSDSEALGELLHFLASRTGCLLVESSSLLQHAEGELLSRFAEAVVLVVDGPGTKPGQLRRGMALLEELGVRQAAVIANKLPELPGGYFAAARAAFEGNELKNPLFHETHKALLKAIRLGRGSRR